MDRAVVEPQTQENTDRLTLARELTFRDGMSLVVGTVIGSGIFLVPGPIAHQLRPLSSVILVWIIGGLLSLFGALSIGELAAIYPSTGGLYVYLRHVYGRPLAFLYGWSLFGVIQSGSIATLAAGFALYLSQLTPISYFQQKLVAITCILSLSVINCVGLSRAKLLQNIASICKVMGIGVLVASLFWRGHLSLLQTSMQLHQVATPSLLAFGTALTAVLWGYEGWHNVSFVAAEFRSPQRDLPKALMYGTLTCAFVYVIANLAYYAVLTPDALKASDHAAATALLAAYGPRATLLVSLLILVSILGATNGNVLAGPRVYYAMAKDGLFASLFSNVSARFRTPVNSILLQGVWASLLTLTGTFQQLYTYVIFTAWMFYALTVAGTVVLRIRKPDLDRPFRAPAFPWIQIAFVLAALSIAFSTIIDDPLHAAIGIGIVLTGIPLYLLARRSSTSTASN